MNENIKRITTKSINKIKKKHLYFYYIFYCATEFDVDATQEKKEEIIAARQEEEFQTRYKEWRGVTHIEVNEAVWDALSFDMESVG